MSLSAANQDLPPEWKRLVETTQGSIGVFFFFFFTALACVHFSSPASRLSEKNSVACRLPTVIANAIFDVTPCASSVKVNGITDPQATLRSTAKTKGVVFSPLAPVWMVAK